jgi:alpha-2-macroglobulin
MKKLPAAFLLLLAVGFCISCKTKDAHAKPVSTEEFIGRQVNASDDEEIIQLANEAAIEAAFTLDYRPQTAEGGDEAEFLSAAALSGTAVEGSGKGTILGGGLRKLSDYKTVYFDPAKEKSRIEAIRAAQEKGGEGQLQKAKNAGPLTVIDWGPRGNYSSAIQRPSIYVIFSHPMTALASLGEQSSTSPLVSINPPIKGSFRWYGTSFLSFEGDEPCQSQQTYTITVAANAASIYGAPISGERVFSFYTETLSIKNIYPGEEFRKQTKFRFDNNSVPPAAAQQIGLEFNYPVQAAAINQYLEISNGKTPFKFTLTQENEYKITASLSDPVEFETTVTITLRKGAKSQGGSRGTETDQLFTFRTPGVFKIGKHRRAAGYGRYNNLVEIEFSYPLNESTALKAISTEPAMPIGKDNVEIWGDTLRLYNLPVGYGAKFKVLVAASVEDVYGRTLSKAWSGDVVVPDEPPPEGAARFLDYGHAMLEAQFPPRFLFEYTNIAADSSYLLIKNNNPWNESFIDPVRINLIPGKVNNKYFEEINLSPYLNQQGKGFVSFRANLQLLATVQQKDGTYRTGTYDRENELNIQVTDLGLTVRYGFNKTTVLVTSLSTGKPVEGATVRLLPPSQVTNGIDVSLITHFSEAQTDKNGFAVLRTGASVLRDNTENTGRWWGFETPFVLAEKDGDRAIFTPSSHNNWRFGIESGLPQRAEEITSLAFMFSDRGLYKPGEILTFRGVDRSKVLGMYTIYRGDYTVTLEEDVYESQPVAIIQNTTSESGGFYGSINIPDDLNPGSYRLVYKRDDGISKRVIANIPITVAYF